MGYQYELRHLSYFQAVAEELHFRKAAERLFISQPGLSRQIRQLEEVLNVQLFERTQRKVVLTEAGKFLQEEVNRIFDFLDKTEVQLRRIHSGAAGEIKIGFVGSAMQNVIPELILKLNQDFPAIGSSMEELSVHLQLERIKREKLDVGFVRIGSVSEELQKKWIFRDSFSVVLPTDHMLDSSSFKSIKQLKDESFILFSKTYSSYYHDKIMDMCLDHGFVPKTSHKSIHANTIFKLVESKLGIAIVPSSLQHGFDYGIKFLEIPNIRQQAELSIVWKKSNKNPALKNFLSLL